MRLLRPDELPADWDPATDPRLTAWEIVHHLIRALEAGGEGAAAELVAKLGAKAEIARELAYRLYTLCERKKRAAEALAYNGLVQSWPEIVQLLAREGGSQAPDQHGRCLTMTEPRTNPWRMSSGSSASPTHASSSGRCVAGRELTCSRDGWIRPVSARRARGGL